MPKGTGEYSLKMADGVGDEILTSMLFASNFFIYGIPEALMQRLKTIIQCDE